MNPTENLRRQRQLAQRILEASDGDVMEINAGDACELAELVQALDRWITAGGFLPGRWACGNVVTR